jgi:hypothetical protein
VAIVRKVAKVGAVKTERNSSRSERNAGVSCMCGLLVARDPGCVATPRIHPSLKEDAIEHAYSPLARSAKPELNPPLLKRKAYALFSWKENGRSLLFSCRIVTAGVTPGSTTTEKRITCPGIKLA